MRPSPDLEARDPGTRPSPPAPPAAASGPPGRLILLLAVACGLTVANLYYVQPLLPELRAAFGVGEVAAGGVVTITQLGYAVGMLFLVPLGDRIETRKLVGVLLLITTGALLLGASAPAFPVLLAAAAVSGATSVVVQVLIPFAADLAPDHARGRVVGQVVSGLLVGVLLSRTLGSLLAEATSWRVVYLVSAVLMAVLAVTLRAALPRHAPTARMSYAGLLRSTADLVRDHPPLRRRALYQAAMFGAFSAFWTTIPYVLTAPPFHYSQLGIGLFALVGAGGAAVAPAAGRWADRGLSGKGTGVAFTVAALAFALAGLGRHQIVPLALAALALDAAVQANLVFGQHTIYRLDPTARARINSAYIATFFLGGAAGSELGSLTYHAGGWTALTVLGAAPPIAALLAHVGAQTGDREGESALDTNSPE